MDSLAEFLEVETRIIHYTKIRIEIILSDKFMMKVLNETLDTCSPEMRSERFISRFPLATYLK